MNKFTDVESYDVDELIQQQRLLIPQTAQLKSDEKPGVSMVARAAASLRSALGMSDTEAKKWVESVLTAEHKSHLALNRDALAAYFKARGDDGADHASPT